nr:hypothetical protein [Pseudomonas mendocina]
MFVVADGIDLAAQHILNAAPPRLFGQAHVSRQDAHPDTAADRQALIARPQTATREIHAHQVPILVYFAHRGIKHCSGIVTEPER